VMVPRVMVFGVPHSLAHHLRIRNAEDHQLFVISVGHHTVHTRQMSNKVPQSALAFLAATDFNYWTHVTSRMHRVGARVVLGVDRLIRVLVVSWVPSTVHVKPIGLLVIDLRTIEQLYI
jgi:hypothetical protein